MLVGAGIGQHCANLLRIFDPLEVCMAGAAALNLAGRCGKRCQRPQRIIGAAERPCQERQAIGEHYQAQALACAFPASPGRIKSTQLNACDGDQ